MSQLPFVSLVTPTYNRRFFWPSMLSNFTSQLYPAAKMEWIIFDDGTDSIEDLVVEAQKKHPQIRYIRSEEKLLIGQKRNRLNDEARGDLIVSMDDDDYYSNERVSHVVQMFARNPKIELAGSSEIFMYYTDNKKIYKIGPYGPKHATNGTMAWRKSYNKTHRYDDYHTHAEEKSFLDNYVNPMIQLDSRKVMLVIAHSMNTFDKRGIRDQPNNPMFKLTTLKLKDFVKSAEMRAHFERPEIADFKEAPVIPG